MVDKFAGSPLTATITYNAVAPSGIDIETLISFVGYSTDWYALPMIEVPETTTAQKGIVTRDMELPRDIPKGRYGLRFMFRNASLDDITLDVTEGLSIIGVARPIDIQQAVINYEIAMMTQTSIASLDNIMNQWGASDVFETIATTEEIEYMTDFFWFLRGLLTPGGAA